ncbi:MAG: hypothetical protein M1268_04190 [Patescibacteria group bacterium]|nr:hypothetical protein [Patescibacteria group bacterium]
MFKQTVHIVALFFLSSIFYLLFSITPSYAQSQTHQQNQYAAPNTNPDIPQNLHTWTQNAMIEVMSAMTCQLTGVDPVNPNQKCLGVDQKTGKIGFVENGGGAIGVMGNMIATLYTPPIHTSDYFNYLARNFGLAKPVYASTGLDSIKPLMQLWVIFRNMVYFVFILIFIIIGLMIMLRVKIDPRTVMTIQNQIPRIIIGVIMVTFSFAIAGFLIDLMWILMYLTFGVFSNANLAIDVSNLNPTILQGRNVLEAVGGTSNGPGVTNIGNISGMANNIASSATAVVGKIFDINQNVISFLGPSEFINFLKGFAGLSGLKNNVFNWLIDIASTSIGIGTGAKVSSMIGTPLISAGVGISAGLVSYGLAQSTLRLGLPYLLVFLIVFIAILWALFRLWFKLVMAYVAILIGITLSPFWIVAGIIPAVGGRGFVSWLRYMLSYLLAFPTTIAMLLLGNTMMNIFNKNSSLFVPPLIGNPTGGEVGPIGSLIGMGFILLTPRVVTYMQQVLKPPKVDLSPIVTALGVGTGAISGSGKAVAASRTPLPGNPTQKAGMWGAARQIFRFQ